MSSYPYGHFFGLPKRFLPIGFAVYSGSDGEKDIIIARTTTIEAARAVFKLVTGKSSMEFVYGTYIRPCYESAEHTRARLGFHRIAPEDARLNLEANLIGVEK